MDQSSTHLQTDDTFWAEREDVPGEKAMWIFVLGDFLIFSSYFVVYLVHRAWAHQSYLESQRHLNLNIGIFNTIVLISGSWSVAWAVHAARLGNAKLALRLVRLCSLSGAIFAIVKLMEWTLEIQAGHTWTSTEFFSYYFVLTEIHFIHLLFGLGFLHVVTSRLEKGVVDVRLLESGATYWHMVDLLWVLILTFLYMIR
jgi:nitric oxide reductase NorE protein